MGKGVVDERHPQYIGTAALSDYDFLHCALKQADLIINIGHDVIEKPPFFMRPGRTRVIHINYFPAIIDEVYFPQLEVVGDIANTVQGLEQRLSPNPSWDFSLFYRAREMLKIHIGEYEDDSRFPVSPQHLVARVRQVMPEEGVVVLDNGMYKIWFARNYPAYQPNTLLLDNALASMGAGLPSAMAARLVHPERPVLAVSGDGGFLMTGEELETALRLKLNLTLLVLRDNGLGMIQWKQNSMNLPRFGLDFQNPDFVKLAQAYGALGHRLERTEDLPALLEHCLASPGIHVLDIPVDYSENERILNQELPHLTARLETIFEV